jgi:undecaprenyl-diphosphatase
MMAFDEGLFRAAYSLAHQSSILDGVIIFSAKYLAWFVVIGAVVELFRKSDWGENTTLWKNRFRVFALGFLAVILSRGIISNILHSLIESPRPFVALGIDPLFKHLAVNSLPSGHMAFLMPIALTLFLLSRKAGWYGLLAVLVVGCARVIAGVHWPSDIVIGALIGLISFAVVRSLFKRKGLLAL